MARSGPLLLPQHRDQARHHTIALAYHGDMITNDLLPAGEAEGHTTVDLPGRIAIHEGPIHHIGSQYAGHLAPATHIVHEWHEYRVTCAGAEWLEVGSEHVATFGPATFRVQFANQLGLSRIRAFDASGAVLDTGHVEVISPKLGDPATSLAFLRAILAELTSERGAMAFMPRATTSRTVRKVRRPPSLLIQYFFLLNNAESIMSATHQVERFPHRILDDESEHVAIHDVTDIDADVVLQLVQGGAVFDHAVSVPRLRAAPGGVWFRVPREGFDSAENRFVKAVADTMANACDDVLRAPWLENLADLGVSQRRETLTRLQNRLRQFARAPMFDDVGPMHRVPVSSRVLQRRAGYRDLNEHWQAFLQSRDPVWQRMQHAIDLRDIATLYEYWVWFALCREIQEAFECENAEVSSVPPSELGPPHGLKARFNGLGTLTYNASRRAYSGILLRPDYLWEPVQGRAVGFDAKFRLAWDDRPLDVDNEAPNDPMARAKVDDLVKMHAYRDAIPDLRCAVVLFPGSVAEFRTVAKEELDGNTVGDVLNGEFEGVGAIPMSPVGWNDD